jgi:hypothetical protein
MVPATIKETGLKHDYRIRQMMVPVDQYPVLAYIGQISPPL